MQDLYVYVKDDGISVCNRQQIYDILYQNYGLLMSSQMPVSQLGYFNIFPAEVKTVHNVDKPFEKYLITRNHGCRKVDGKWVVELYQELDTQAMDREWDRLNREVDAIINNLSWLLSSKKLSAKCRKQYEAYCSLLKNIVKEAIVPDEVILPEPPTLEYTQNVEVESVKLSEEELIAIQNYVPKTDNQKTQFNKFLSAWESLKYTNAKNVVSQLLAAYAPDVKIN